jgi:transglutaminase-like putative cysteine protease
MRQEDAMKIRAGYDIVYESPQPTSKILLLSVHTSRQHDLLTPQTMRFEPDVPASNYIDGFGNVCTRVVAPAGLFRISADFLVQDSGLPDIVVPEAIQHPVAELPDDVLVYLLGSRYCDTDLMGDTAWSLFKDTAPGWQRVQAICDYVHNRLTFGYGHARSTRTAREGFNEQRGVCRDFAHLAITFCRCMNIPARYCTGYLGDIGVPAFDEPMDFSAWFEVYLDGQWYTFDARHNEPRIGRILIARGRDATDVAISTSFGAGSLAKFTVVTEEVRELAA